MELNTALVILWTAAVTMLNRAHVAFFFLEKKEEHGSARAPRTQAVKHQINTSRELFR